MVGRCAAQDTGPVGRAWAHIHHLPAPAVMSISGINKILIRSHWSGMLFLLCNEKKLAQAQADNSGNGYFPYRYVRDSSRGSEGIFTKRTELWEAGVLVQSTGG